MRVSLGLIAFKMSITNLPDELLLRIWQYLSPEDIFNMATISPVWERISHEKIARPKFINVTFDNRKMSVGRTKSFINFIRRQSPWVINLTCSYFSTAEFCEIVSFIKVAGLRLIDIKVTETKLDFWIFKMMNPNFDICEVLKIEVTEYPDDVILGLLSQSERTQILIFVIANGEVEREYRKCVDSAVNFGYYDGQYSPGRHVWRVSIYRHNSKGRKEENISNISACTMPLPTEFYLYPILSSDQSKPFHSCKWFK